MRSILGDARSSRMQSVMNLKIKFRESFRPFAPVVLADRASEFFEIRGDQESPYMLLTVGVRTTNSLFCATAARAGWISSSSCGPWCRQLPTWTIPPASRP